MLPDTVIAALKIAMMEASAQAPVDRVMGILNAAPIGFLVGALRYLIVKKFQPDKVMLQAVLVIICGGVAALVLWLKGLVPLDLDVLIAATTSMLGVQGITNGVAEPATQVVQAVKARVPGLSGSVMRLFG